MANTQNVYDLLSPVHVDDRAIVSDPELVSFDGAEMSEIPRRTHCNRLEFARDPLSDGFVKLAEFFRREFGELDPERQALSLLHQPFQGDRFTGSDLSARFEDVLDRLHAQTVFKRACDRVPNEFGLRREAPVLGRFCKQLCLLLREFEANRLHISE